MVKRYVHELVFQCGTFILAAAIPFSTHISTWCLIILAVNWVVEGGLKQKIRIAYRQRFVVICSLLYLLELSSLFVTRHLQDGLYHAQTEASLLVIPLLYLSRGRLEERFVSTTLKVFCISVFLCSLYCIGIGSFRYFQSGDITFLFYHPLVEPIGQHAVYFSIYVFICVVFLFHELKKRNDRQNWGFLLLLVYLLIVLFLLRSKIMVGIALIYGSAQLLKSIKSGNTGGSRGIIFPGMMIIGILVVLLTSNPLSRQVQSLEESHPEKLSKKEFSPAVYFNEIELRLLLWKFSFEILHEQEAWITGVTGGDARTLINKKIIAANMYTGLPGTDDTGYLNYNLHNQYLETLFRSGIVGLFLLLLLLFILIRKAIYADSEIFLFTVGAFGLFFITESVFERQIGIVPFFFFASLWMALESKIQRGKRDDGLEQRQLTLFVDAHSFDRGYQGVCSFIRGLYSGSFFSEKAVLYLGGADVDSLKKIFPHICEQNFISYRWRSPFMRLMVEIPFLLFKYRFDYAHFQYIIPPIRFGKCIVTTHDILFRDFKTDFPFFYRIARNITFKYSLRRADIKSTPSEYTRQRLSFYYRIPEDEIQVVPHGIEEGFCRIVEPRQTAVDYIAAKFNVRNFILNISRIEPRKDQALLLWTYLDMALYQNDISLVFIGDYSLHDIAFEKAWEAIPPYARKYIMRFSQVDQSDLLRFYRAARLFVYPSRAEGFGIPPLEAAALKVPVLCADGGAMSAYTFFRENLFESGNALLFKNRLEAMLSSDVTMASLEDLSELVLSRYSWEHSARCLWKCLN